MQLNSKLQFNFEQRISSHFFIFLAAKLFGAKFEEFKSNYNSYAKYNLNLYLYVIVNIFN